MDPYVLTVLVCSLAVLGTALFLSLHRRRAAIRALEQGVYEDLPLDASIPEVPLRRVPDPTEQDLGAYRVIERHRGRVWWSFRLKTAVSLSSLGDLCLQVVRDVAGVYHPDAERPEMRASVRDLITLNLRVTQRLQGLVERWPVRMIGSLRVDQALWVRRKMREIQESTVGKVLRQSKVGYSVAKWAWRAWNVANPVYWGRQAIYTGSREAAARYLLTSLVTFVGEEAVMTYSGRGGSDDRSASEGADGTAEEPPPGDG